MGIDPKVDIEPIRSVSLQPTLIIVQHASDAQNLVRDTTAKRSFLLLKRVQGYGKRK